MNVNEMTFGVEFEVYLPNTVRLAVGGYHSGLQVPGLPTGWNAQRDGSLNQAPAGYYGVEIVSPILKGANGIQQIHAVCQWLGENNARVNRSTGFHVHVGWAGDEQALDRLAFNVANHEKALYAATGTKAREQGLYTRPIQSNQEYVTRFVSRQASQFLARYHSLNLTNLGNARKRTVEFRVFAGTTNATKAIGYVRICLGLVEKAHTTKRKPKWIAKTPVESSPIHRNGVGQTELTRLFYALGWIKGRQKHVFGNVEATDAPTIDNHKRELMRLAKKYDKGE